MKNISLAVSLLILAACAMPQGGMKRSGGLLGERARSAQEQSQFFVDETINVLTSPAGAKIQVNGAFAGYSPLRYTVRRLWRGEPGNMLLDTVKIEALPAAAGQCVRGGIYGQNNLKVPSPVSFEMSDCKNAYEYPEPAGAHLPAGSK